MIDPDEMIGGLVLPARPGVMIDYADETVRAMTRTDRQVVCEVNRAISSRVAPVN